MSPETEVIQQRVRDIRDRAGARANRQAERRQEFVVATAAALPAAAPAAPAAAGPPPVLVAEGDSWFDYPGMDVLDELEAVFGYEISSVAHQGDTLESMAYGDQLEDFERKLTKLEKAGKAPRAVLLSAGGNDIVGDEFSLLLNHTASGLSPLNDRIVEGLIDVRLRAAYVTLISTVTGLCAARFNIAQIPVIVHGYDNSVPDGRGFMGGLGFLPGPWLRPGFERKGYEDLATNVGVVASLIGHFNRMLASLNASLPNVRHVDLVGTLSGELAGNAYKDHWANELHPKERGFAAVAVKIKDALSAAGVPPQ